ncbi:MAG: hypothetical protein E6Q78_16390 [Rhodoferax sp.]|nr:MAG: hypothetical protein E6Q78_16390 [Rhodoferax sp.]
MNWLRSRLARLFEGGLYALEAAVGFGLVSGAALVSALGQFVLGGILAVFAICVFLRIKRLRKKRSLSPQNT